MFRETIEAPNWLAAVVTAVVTAAIKWIMLCASLHGALRRILPAPGTGALLT